MTARMKTWKARCHFSSRLSSLIPGFSSPSLISSALLSFRQAAAEILFRRVALSYGYGLFFQDEASDPAT